MIIPAILESNFAAIKRKINRIAGLVDWVQIDVCDGRFVPSKTYASTGRATSVKNLVSYTRRKRMNIELDLMVDLDQPRSMTTWTSTLCETTPDRVVFHLGSTYRWDELFSRIKRCSKKTTIGFECGLAIRVGTPRAEIRKLLTEHSEFSYIQIMGISKIGYSGQKLSPEIYQYIKKIKRSFPDMSIQIDGGVKPEHADKLFTAGTDHLGMNSGLFKTKNIKHTIRDILDDK